MELLETKCTSCGALHRFGANIDRVQCSCGLLVFGEEKDITTKRDKHYSRATNLEFHNWPTWAKTLRRLRKAEDKGVGDTVQRIAAWFGGERFKAFSSKIGLPCGCTERQDNWNTQYPYEPGN